MGRYAVVCLWLLGLPRIAVAVEPGDLQHALSGRLPKPDALLRALESPDEMLRRLATQRLATWHPHVPGAIELLRRAVHDSCSTVAVQAVVTASQIGTAGAFQAAIEVLDRDFDPHQRATIVDAFDTRTFRPMWRWSDRYHVRDRILVWKASRYQSHRREQLLALEVPEPSADVIRVGREAMERARCYECHRLAGYGRSNGPKLDDVGECFTVPDLIRHIQEPSAEIHDLGRRLQVITSDGQVHVGWPGSSKELSPGKRDLIGDHDGLESQAEARQQHDESKQIALTDWLRNAMRSQAAGSQVEHAHVDPNALLCLKSALDSRSNLGSRSNLDSELNIDSRVNGADEPGLLRIPFHEVESIQISRTSPMPENLLARLTPTEVADLLAFVLSNGGCAATLPTAHQHD